MLPVDRNPPQLMIRTALIARRRYTYFVLKDDCRLYLALYQQRQERKESVSPFTWLCEFRATICPTGLQNRSKIVA